MRASPIPSRSFLLINAINGEFSVVLMSAGRSMSFQLSNTKPTCGSGVRDGVGVNVGVAVIVGVSVGVGVVVAVAVGGTAVDVGVWLGVRVTVGV